MRQTGSNLTAYTGYCAACRVLLPYLVADGGEHSQSSGDAMETVWTDTRIEALSNLWREGWSTAEIGRRLGVTKNAVVGKAHRLSLSPRPSPVKSTGRPRVRSAKIIEIAGPTCSWPHGHPGDKDFRFCGSRVLAGKPYCAEHAALAYVRPKKPGSNVA